MSTLLSWEEIYIDMDYAEDKVLVTHGGDESLRIEIPITKTRTGGRYIIIRNDMFGKANILPIDLFEHEVSNRLSIEQQSILYNSWGMGLNIMISRTANVLGVEKSVAKEIITLGERHGLLYQANNNTWKIKDAKITKERWIDKAKQLANPTIEKAPLTIKEVTKQFDDMTKSQMGAPIKLSEVTRLVGTKSGTKVVPQKEFTKNKHSQQDSSVIEVPEPSEEMLRMHLKDMEHKISTSSYGKEELPGTVIDKKNKIKEKLREIDAKKAGKQYIKDANMPGVSIVEGLNVGTKGSIQVQPLSKAKLILKKKPLESRPVRKS
jgi:hypothetical protein